MLQGHVWPSQEGLYPMADIVGQLQGFILSATELKAMTDWPDALVEDYLDLIRNIILVASETDVNTGQIDQNTTDIGTNATNISTNTTNIGTNTTNIGNNASDITDLQDDKADKNIPVTVNNIAVLDATGNLDDSGVITGNLVTLDFAGNPNGNVTSNQSRFCVDTAGSQLYFNPAVGANVGWIAV